MPWEIRPGVLGCLISPPTTAMSWPTSSRPGPRGENCPGASSAARDAGNLAQVIFTEPQVATAGRTGSQDRAEGFVVRTRTARYPGTLSFLSLFREGFQGWAKLVINAGDRHTARSDICRPGVLGIGSSGHPGYRREGPSQSPAPRCRATSDGQSGLGSATRPRVRTWPVTARGGQQAHKSTQANRLIYQTR